MYLILSNSFMDKASTILINREMNAYKQRFHHRRFTNKQKELIRAAFEAGREYEKSLQQELIADTLSR